MSEISKLGSVTGCRPLTSRSCVSMESVQEHSAQQSLEAHDVRFCEKEVEHARREVEQAKIAFEMMMDIRAKLEVAYHQITSVNEH